MPNWCCNHLTVTGPKKALDAFKATLNSKDEKGEVIPFSFAQAVPPPANMLSGNLTMEQMAEATAKGIPTWYDWQREHWGCKWNCCETDLVISDKKVDVRFDTPWSPPVEWLKGASAAHPKLKFNLAYCEGGMGYYGEATAKEGEVSEDTSDFPEGTYDDAGWVTGKVAKFVKKHNIGTGG